MTAPALDGSSSLALFTSTADALLKAQPEFNGRGLSVTNIPVYPVSSYTPALHRLIQLAANITDATTNKTGAAPDDFDYPSVFRPSFGVNGSNIFIRGYLAVGTNADYLSMPYSLQDDVTPLIDVLNAGGGTNVINIYGIPWVIGARKGFPNFNKISTQDTIQLRRKLQITRPTITSPRTDWHTNVQYTIGISNSAGIEAWNSYRAAYPRSVSIFGFTRSTFTLTNEFGILTNLSLITNFSQVIGPNTWAGFSNSLSTNIIMLSFRAPMLRNAAVLPDSIYRAPFGLTPAASLPSTFFDTTIGYPQPLFGVNISNRLQFVMVDTASMRVIDYVHLDRMDSRRKVILELAGQEPYGPGGVWDTNRVGALPDSAENLNPARPINGIEMQIDISQHIPPYSEPGYNVQVSSNDWTEVQLPGGFSSRDDAIQKFASFMNREGQNQALAIQAPFTPTRRISVYQTWQAKDPLVHYLLQDLIGYDVLSTLPTTNWDRNIENELAKTFLRVNNNYLPWNGRGNPKRSSPLYSPYFTNLTLKDPLVFSSDDWQFPAGEGFGGNWIGRVHRGTPWQTVYLKSKPVDPDLWVNWTGDNQVRNGLDDSDTSQPTNDWRLAGILTRLLSPYDVNKLFSVNDANLAMVMDGMSAISNSFPETAIEMTPASPQAAAIVAGINVTRAGMPGGLFVNTGDILASPSLSVNSPWLDPAGISTSEAAYETLPSQLLPWLRPDSFGSLAGSASSMAIHFTGLERGLYLIEASRDMQNWQPIELGTPTNGTITVIDPTGTIGPGRFYRSRLLINP